MPEFSDTDQFYPLAEALSDVDDQAPVSPPRLRDEKTGFLETLAKQYGAPIRSFFSRRVTNRSDAEDLAQDVFARLAHRGGLDEIANPEAYLFRSAQNVLTDHLRSRRAHHANDHDSIDHLPGDTAPLATQVTPEHILLHKDEVEKLKAALYSLPERARDCFQLRFFEEISVAEIASGLGISTRAVNYQIAAALTHVTKALAR